MAVERRLVAERMANVVANHPRKFSGGEVLPLLEKLRVRYITALTGGDFDSGLYLRAAVGMCPERPAPPMEAMVASFRAVKAAIAHGESSADVLGVVHDIVKAFLETGFRAYDVLTKAELVPDSELPLAGTNVGAILEFGAPIAQLPDIAASDLKLLFRLLGNMAEADASLDGLKLAALLYGSEQYGSYVYPFFNGKTGRESRRETARQIGAMPWTEVLPKGSHARVPGLLEHAVRLTLRAGEFNLAEELATALVEEESRADRARA